MSEREYFVERFLTFNSTRCIRNLTSSVAVLITKHLSTPHGALGTVLVPSLAFLLVSFNSTRCIRN